MPVPKRKLSRARIRSRAANKGIKPKAFASCKNCLTAILPHKVCEICGFYKGVKILETKMDRALKRGQAKQAKHETKAKVQDEGPSEA